MGLYLYGLKTPGQIIKVTLPDGKVIEAVPSHFLSKPYWGLWGKELNGMVDMGDYGINSRGVNMRAGKVFKAWLNLPQPQYILEVFEEEPEGTLVYREHGFPYIWLEELRGMVTIGQCKRMKGKQWVMGEWEQGYSEPLKVSTIGSLVRQPSI